MSNSDAKLISGFSAPSKSLTDTERSEYQSFICYVQYSRTICILITDDLECPLDLNIVGVISNVDEFDGKRVLSHANRWLSVFYFRHLTTLAGISQHNAVTLAFYDFSLRTETATFAEAWRGVVIDSRVFCRVKCQIRPRLNILSIES